MMRKTRKISLSALFFGAAVVMAPVAGVVAGAGMARAADEQVRSALDAYGAIAGRIEASVPFCGGPKEEEEYFIRQVRELAEKAGAGAVEWPLIRTAMLKAKGTARFRNHDCTDEGGRALANELLVRQRALQAALQ